MNIGNLYNKYKNWVVILLFGMFCFKSCQSCSNKRQLAFNNIKHNKQLEQYSNEIDSLNIIILKKDNELIMKNDSINLLQSKIDMLIENNETLKNNNRHYQQTNKTLIQTNKEIINKENDI